MANSFESAKRSHNKQLRADPTEGKRQGGDVFDRLTNQSAFSSRKPSDATAYAA